MTLDGVAVVLVDIEGTVSPTATVHGQLFDDARRQLRPWVGAHAADPEIAAALGDVRAVAGLADDTSLDEQLAVLQRWIDEDVKATPLKTIQGRIWAEGFADGRLHAEFFPDAVPALRRWHAAGAALAVYSSGSVTVQRPWFAELDGSIDAFFDTVNAGPKREQPSYDAIAAAVEASHGCGPGAIVFLSDVPAELDAAVAAGLRVVGVARPGEPFADADFGGHPVIADFARLELTPTRSVTASATETIARNDAATGSEPTAADVLATGQKLADEARYLAGHGWMRATAGNLSAVVGRDPLRLVVTASAVDKGELVETDVVLIDADGSAVAVDGIETKRPSAEAELHAHIAATTGAGAVVHVHALASVVAAERFPDGVPIAEVEMVKAFGHDADGTAVIPVIANSQSMQVLAERLDAVRDPAVPAVIVARHGMYVWGDTLRQARHHVEGIEWALNFVNAVTAFPDHTTGGPRSC